jgi:4-amino-4-deoxy-L-arabinose transferase-like glycosyltransferase
MDTGATSTPDKSSEAERAAKSPAAKSALIGPKGALALLAIAILCLCVRNLPWHLDDYDQAKQAYVPFEMVERGNWFLQHTPHQYSATKPPLMGWLSAGLFYIMRWWDGAWRLPGLLAALFLMYLLKREGDTRFARPVGILVVAVFALNIISPRVATLVRTDMLLSLATFIPGWLIWRKILARTPWTSGERWTFCIAVLCGVLTKGPVLYAFLLPGLTTYLLMDKQNRRYVWCGWWPWMVPLVVFLGWAGTNALMSRQFYDDVVLKEFMGRFTTGEKAVHRPQPVYYYIMHLTIRFAPWSILLAVLLSGKKTRQSLRSQPGTVWLLCWAFAALIFMSVVPSKRIDRIFPIIPVLALATGAMASLWLERGAHWGRWSAARWLTLTIWLGAITAAGYTTANLITQYRTPTDALVRFSERVRARAEPDHLRLAVTPNRHEGMLLYLRQPEYTPLPLALRALSSGELDLLVLSSKEFDQSPAKAQWEILETEESITGPKTTYYCVRRKPQ